MNWILIIFVFRGAHAAVNPTVIEFQTEPLCIEARDEIRKLGWSDGVKAECFMAWGKE